MGKGYTIDDIINILRDKAEIIKAHIEPKVFNDVADVLEDYKEQKLIDEDLRLKYSYEDLSNADYWGYLRGYKKAIDDYVKQINRICFSYKAIQGNLVRLDVLQNDLHQTAEQLKAGVENE